jgi:glyoxylase-like metal-dependent hydrolase (beta-lactamase superfamily II)
MLKRRAARLHLALALVLFLVSIDSCLTVARAASESPAVRLYALDCGRAVFKDMSMFSDTDEYDGQPGQIVDPCFLIQHPMGTLVWDTGLGDKLADNREGTDMHGIRLYVDVTLQSQLQSLGLRPEDIKFVAFSHFHFDHTGNANLFSQSTWIINRRELDAAVGLNPPSGEDKSTFSAYQHVNTQIVEGDYDVFGDGTVRILQTPGHTPGHQVLMLRLSKSGVVLLSGDLYHTMENRRLRRVPRVNTERADTLASIDRFEHLAQNTRARVIVQHDPDAFHSLPKFPRYLD